MLSDIGAADVPILKVFNKVDETDSVAGVERNDQGELNLVRVSALSGEGLEGLQLAIRERLSQGRIEREIAVPASLQRLRARLFDLGAVRGESVEPDGTSILFVVVDRRDAQSLSRLGGPEGQLVDQVLLN